MPEHEREEGVQSMDRRRLLQTGLGVAAALGLGGAGFAVAKLASPGREAATKLTSKRISGLPVDDPTSSVWKRLAPYEVILTPQQLAAPFLKAGSIPSVLVRSANDGQSIAFHLEWAKATQDDVEVMDRFRDAAALMFPVNEGALPPITMGDAQNPVYVVQWKSTWQRRVDGAPDSLTVAFPNAWRDVLPEQILKPEVASQYYPARAVGNPMVGKAGTAVEAGTANTFGTLQSLTNQAAHGKGVYAKGAWNVVVTLPMNGGVGAPLFTVGKESQVAVAIWNGADANAGGRKHYASWMPVAVEGA